MTQQPSPPLRVAAIHDLSGFGRASLTVVIPVLATMGIQTCPLPTAVLSSQTSGVDDFTFHDLTPLMDPMLDHWQRLHLRFDAVYSGFLGNPIQAETVTRCIREFLTPQGIAVVDPVLGDNGELDPTQTPEMVASMRRLAGKAHVITPNFTEAAFLLQETYDPDLTLDRLKEWLMRLAAMGPSSVVITSAPAQSPDYIASVAYDRALDRFWRVQRPKIPAFYPGTGDMFASVLTGGLLQGDSLPVAMDRAAQFVALAIDATYGDGTCAHALPHRDGVLLERVLGSLRSPYVHSSYTEF